MNEKQAELYSITDLIKARAEARGEAPCWGDLDELRDLAVKLLGGEEVSCQYVARAGAREYEVVFYPSAYCVRALVTADSKREAEIIGVAKFKNYLAALTDFKVQVKETEKSKKLAGTREIEKQIAALQDRLNSLGAQK